MYRRYCHFAQVIRNSSFALSSLVVVFTQAPTPAPIIPVLFSSPNQSHRWKITTSPVVTINSLWKTPSSAYRCINSMNMVILPQVSRNSGCRVFTQAPPTPAPIIPVFKTSQTHPTLLSSIPIIRIEYPNVRVRLPWFMIFVFDVFVSFLRWNVYI